MMKRLPLLLMAVFLGFALQAQISTFPYSESWEAGGTGSWTQSTSDDLDWTNNTGGTTSSSTGPTSASDGTNYLYTETSGSSNGDIAILENDFNFSSLSAPQLIFDYHMYFGGASNGGTLDVDVSTNGGTTWTNEWSKSGDQGNQWNVFEIVDLSSYGNQSGVKVRFHFTTGQNTTFQNDCAIDDIIVQQQPSCPRPLNLRAKTLQAFNAVIGWDTVAAATNGYEVIYGTSGFDPATGGTSITTTADSASLTGLSSATDYDFYLIADCGSSNGISDTAGPATFRTLCAGFSAPYTNNFDNGTDGQLANCWAQWNSYDNFAYARVESSPFGITPASGSNVLEMYSYTGFTSTDTLAAISPRFTDMTAGDKQIEFKAAAGVATNDIYVGTTNSQAPGSSVTYIDTVTFNTTGTFQTVRISLDSANGYNGTDEYIVLEHSLGGTFDDLWIDDFKYQVIPPCPDPFRFSLVSTTDTSGTITFDHPDSTFNYNWGPCGFTQGSPTSSFASGAGNPFTAGGLTPNTCYDIYVQADCSGSGNGTSGWAGPFSFRTQCSPFTAPYSQNFDGTTEPEVDPCWNTINTTGASSAFAGTENFRSNSAPNSIELYNQSATSGDLMLVSPAFSDLDSNKRISFWVNDDDDDSDLLIGTMSDFADPATFTAFDTITAADMDDDTWEQFVIDMTGYSGTDKHIAFKHGLGSTFDNIYIDDFKYDVIPQCDGPLATTLGTTSITANSAGVFWGSGGQGDTTKVVWGSSGFDPNTTRLGIGFTSGTDTTFNITGLSPQTTYDFYIQDSCAVGGAGTYVGPFTFTTACLPVTAPYSENFDNTTTWTSSSIDPCWSANPGPGAGFSHRWEANSGSTGSFNTGPSGDHTSGSGQYMFTETSPSSPPTAVLTTPLVDVSTLNVPYFEFFYHRYGSDMGDLTVDVNDGSGWTTIITLRGDDQQSSGDPWKESGADISTFGDTVQVRFSSTRGGGFGGDGAIDDIAFKEAPACSKPANLRTSRLVDTGATITWLGGSKATNYEVWFGNSGFFQGTQTAGGVKVFTGAGAADSLAIDTLTPNTCYEFLVRAICQPGDTSEWVGPVTFCTPCTPFNAPYFQNWDSTLAPNVDRCWSPYLIGSSNAIETDNSAFNVTPRSSPNMLLMEVGSVFSNDTTAIVSPTFDDMTAGDKRVTLYAAAEFNNGQNDLFVGTAGNPGDGSTFNFLDTIEVTTTTLNQAIINLNTQNGYNGTDKHIVIMVENNASFDDVYVEDFRYETIPSCPRPFPAQVGTVDSTSANISWQGSSAGSFQIEFGTGSFGSASNQDTIVNSSNPTLSGLMDGTDYCYWVRAICAAGDTSAWTGPTCFRTECRSQVATYTQNFDNQGSGETPLCWTPYFVGGASQIFETVTFDQPNSAPNHLRIYNGSTDTTLGISPLFRDMDNGDRRLRLQVKKGATFYSSNLWVGTMSDPNRASTITIIDTLSLTTTYQEFIVPITTGNGYNGTDERIVLMHDGNSTFDEIYVDDFVYEVIPTCIRPSNLSSSNITQNTADLDWTSNDTGNTYQVEYGANPFGDTANTRQIVTGDSLSLSGLSAGSAYCYWVRQICTPGDTSLWQGPECFNTLCPTSFPAPYKADFENITEGSFLTFDNCWTTTTTSGVPRWIAQRSTGSNQNSFNTGPIYDHTRFGTPGGTYMFTENSGASQGATVDLEGPSVDVSTLNTPQISFWYFMHGATLNQLEIRVDTGSGFYSVDTIIGEQQTSQSDPWGNYTRIINTNATTMSVMFRHYAGSSFTSDIAVDDVEIREAPSCPAPGGLSASGVTTTSGQITWDTTTVPGASSYLVETGSVGFSAGSGMMQTVSGNSFTLTGMNTINICQEAYVYAICASGDTGLAAGPIKVCPKATLCGDSLDQYATGSSFLDESALLLPWPGAAGDAEISTAQAASGSNSLHLDDAGPAGLSDVVAVFDTISSGAWEVAFKMYIPSGDGGYYNIQQNYVGGGTGNLWGADVFFDDAGNAELRYTTGGTVAGTWSYTQGQWFDMSTIIDLDNDTLWVEYNGTAQAGFQYSLFNGAGNPLQFNGVNFFAGTGDGTYDENYYVDNICISQYSTSAPNCPAPTGLAATSNVGCDSIEVSWTSNSGSSFIQWGPAGFTPGNGTFTGIISSPHVFSGLTPNTSYDFWVADTCGGDTSAYMGPVTISTANSPQPVASFTTDSAIVGGTELYYLDATGSSNATSFNWNFGNGVTSTNAVDTASYAVNGNFTITLIVSNACGSDTATYTAGVNIGMEENPISRSLNVYPNPTYGTVNLEFDVPTSSSATVRVLDMRGRVVKQRTDNQLNGRYDEQWDLSNLARGMYMIEIESGEMRAQRRLNLR